MYRLLYRLLFRLLLGQSLTGGGGVGVERRAIGSLSQGPADIKRLDRSGGLRRVGAYYFAN
jgi:hypothetical protein